ncbi:hypothetical protein [Pseudonocardia acidicola]|uniref:Lsr2 protein n=1 Tax=Pseudonocardia acidicola TaxID=2724939 RepID=A0ABX1SBG3_9PSEU|nr:hypothetical protein [Pseudonocardia acidicola]NMH98904.1 hypothetical protein [Pseudonocardia acidicola]
MKWRGDGLAGLMVELVDSAGSEADDGEKVTVTLDGALWDRVKLVAQHETMNRQRAQSMGVR